MKKLNGVIIRPRANDGLEGFRKVTLFSETLWYLDEHLAPADKRLRAKQPFETFEQLCKDQSAQRPVEQSGKYFSCLVL